jgi:hypothetical protein
LERLGIRSQEGGTTVIDIKKVTEREKIYTTAYEQVCTTYHAIDDFRAKLLGFLPVVSAAGAVVLVKDVAGLKELPEFFVFAGVFGALITIGLFLYEVRGIRHCTFLINRGRKLERKLGLGAMGQFAHWDPNNPLGRMKIADFPRAAQVIYPTVFANWVFLASYGLNSLGWIRVSALGVGLGAWVVALVVAWRMTERASRPECTCRISSLSPGGSSRALARGSPV